MINAKNLKELVLKLLLSQAGQKEKGVLNQDPEQRHQTTPGSISLTGVNICQAKKGNTGRDGAPYLQKFLNALRMSIS